MKKKLIIAFGICACLLLVACKKPTAVERDYSEEQGKVTGKVIVNNGGADLDIKDVRAGIGQIIDYTGGINISSADEDAYVQIDVDTSGVDNFTPGTYMVDYIVTYDDSTYTQKAAVTIEDNGEQGEKQTTKKDTSPKPTSQSGDIGDQSGEYETSASPVKDLGNATIELLNGGTVSISQSTARYITRTYTDESTVEKSNGTYMVSKLIVEFNTGDVQVLETIERPVY